MAMGIEQSDNGRGAASTHNAQISSHVFALFVHVGRNNAGADMDKETKSNGYKLPLPFVRKIAVNKGRYSVI